MNTTDKLNRIKAKCQEIIALGEKWTQGNWTPDPEGAPPWLIVAGNLMDGGSPVAAQSHRMEDAFFIAACAGTAEAMARSTIAAIDGLQSIGWYSSDGEIHSDHSHNGRTAQNVINAIISAWEGIV